jgi:AraC-like DNA-binding protein
VLRRLADANEQPGFGQMLLCRALVLQFLIFLTRSMDDADIRFVADAACDAKTVAILHYLHEHMEEDLSIDRIAEEFYISKSHMMHRFKAETGYTIHGYLTEKRLLAARDRIAAGMPITEAAFRSGFRDYSAFSRAYKKQFGEMPKRAAPAVRK